jgi:hypothetical protein
VSDSVMGIISGRLVTVAKALQAAERLSFANTSSGSPREHP